MTNYEVVIPKLGEAVIEATITKWLKHEGDMVQAEEPVIEIATDKVDSEITSAVTGRLIKKLFPEGAVVPVGAAFAILETTEEQPELEETRPAAGKQSPQTGHDEPQSENIALKTRDEALPVGTDDSNELTSQSGTRFYSPLVRSIARRENIPFSELDNIPGTGKDDRLTKQDLLDYMKTKHAGIKPDDAGKSSPGAAAPAIVPPDARQIIPGEDRIVEMDRIRQLISAHMVRSVQTSPHVTSFQEVDMSRIVQWREKNKEAFRKRENGNLTFTPVFIEAIAKAVMEFPMVNVSVDGTKIVVYKNVNIGMAVSLPGFNLIVPVIRQAHEKSLLGIVKAVNDLAQRARAGKLVPDEITGGTISLTNLGSFGTLMGTPIINQPQTCIVATGAIKKRVVVVESPEGDTMAIRPVMIMSVTYDHRVIDGSLGGQFLARIVYHLENFDASQSI